MKKLVYISSESFFDVDFPILKELNQNFDLVWIPVLRTNGWYTKDEIVSFCDANKIKYIALEQKYFYKDPRILLFYLKLLTTIKSQEADILYFEYFGVPLFHHLTPLFIKMEKSVIAVHDVEQHYKMEYGKMKALYFEYIFKKFQNFQVFSEAQLTLFNSKYPGKNVFEAKLYLKDFGLPSISKARDNKVNFLFFGIIRANKGLNLLISAANILGRRRNDFRITVAGDSKDWDMYDKTIHNKDNFNLIIRKIRNEEIPNLFISADYLVLPYVDVTQSGVLLTSYNYNLPAITSDLEGFHEYIEDGYNGFMFEPNNVQSLVLKLEYILDNHQDIYPIINRNLETYLSEKINLKQISNQYVSFFNGI